METIMHDNNVNMFLKKNTNTKAIKQSGYISIHNLFTIKN